MRVCLCYSSSIPSGTAAEKISHAPLNTCQLHATRESIRNRAKKKKKNLGPRV